MHGLYRDTSGVSPKRLCSIVRFRAIFDRLEQPDGASWARIAFDCGYFDQAHLSREFKHFAGVTPSSYRALGTAMGRRLSGIE